MLKFLFIVFVVSTLCVEIINASAATVSVDSLTFSNRALGSLTTATYSFQVSEVLATNDAIALVMPSFMGTTASVAASVVSGCGTTTFTDGAANTGEVTFVVTLTAANAQLAADTQCTVAISGLTTTTAYVESRSGFTHAFTFAANGGSANVAATAITTVQTIGGYPILYSKISTCRKGGIATGAVTAKCFPNPALSVTQSASHGCFSCNTEGYSFVETHGTACATSTSASNANPAGVRCDALQYTSDSMDIYFNTDGIEGTYWCAAYTTGATIAGQHISTQTVHATTAAAPRSKNYITIDAKAADKDHVITLNQLTPDTTYDVYCHGNDALVNGDETKSRRTFWTAPNPTLWGVSLVRSILTATSTEGTLTLTFSHGAALAASATIKLTTSADIWTSASATDCAATRNGVTLATLSSRTPTTSNLDEMKFALNAGEGSAAGGQIIITCSTILTNPSAGATTFELLVDGHDVLLLQVGPTFV